jgi:hypothetical protein
MSHVSVHTSFTPNYSNRIWFPIDCVCVLRLLSLMTVETMTRKWQQYTAVRGTDTSAGIPVSIFAEISYIARNRDLKVSFKGHDV